MTTISRRRFLRISSAVLGTAAAGSAVVRATAQMAAPDLARTSSLHRVPTFCDICFWKCGAVATVRDGELWKLEGNPLDPLSSGRLCPRGTGGVGARRDQDRLRAPLMRKAKRGDEEWVEVTWDEAFDFIARKMETIKTTYGPEAMALFSHGIGGTFLKHTMKAYGTPNIAAPSFAQCRGPRDVGFRLTFGEDVSSPERTDIRNARCLVLIGSHLGENMHNTQVQEFADAVGSGATVIVVDPRFSVAAGKASHYLPIKPGTDTALLLAWMHVLITEELYDREYVGNYGFGFEQLVAHVREFTPEWAYPITGIDPDLIRATAREMGKNRPATLVHPGRHVTWYGNDAQRSRAIAILNGLLGSWGRRGGFYTPVSMDVPTYPTPPYPTPAREKVDNPSRRYPFAHETITTGIRDATLSGSPYPIRGWMVYATNLLHALPNEQETIRAMQNLDLMVVIDVIPSEIAGWADVVLPEAIYLERYDELNVEWFREPFVGLRQPVLDPPDEQKPNWWIAKRLAEHLDLGQYYPWEHIEDYLRHRVAGAGLDWEELQRTGIIRGPKQPTTFEEGVNAEFGTPSGKIEFYSPQLADAGFDPMPVYAPVPEPPPGSFRLLYGRSPVHSFSRTHTNPVLMDMAEENDLWVHPTMASRRGLRTGDYVRLKNQDGVMSERIRLLVTERIRPDCVYMVHGFGHTSRMLTRAYRKGASDAGLITRYATDPLMGGTGMNVNFVTLEAEEA